MPIELNSFLCKDKAPEGLFLGNRCGTRQTVNAEHRFPSVLSVPSP